MAAYQSLGPFLAALEKNQVTDELVGHFTSMATTAASQLGGSGEVDIKFHCAFNFPAVVSILGPADWLKLSPAFELLHNDTFWKIRRSFAYSLHALARILGQGITETQLATAFDSYLHDVQDVRLGVMLHFADFLENVSPSFRESYLPVLAEFDSFDNTTKWRFREVLSGQLSQLCHTFTPEATFSVIYPLVFKLITDPVSAVREQSYHACPLLVARLSSNSEWLTAVIDNFVTLARSSHYQDRQCFVKICASFLSTTSGQDEDADERRDKANADAARSFFSAKLAAVFFTLALDPVSNVRVVFSETAIKHQRLCRKHPDCPGSLRDILTATAFSCVDELADVLSGRMKVRLAAQANLDSEKRSKEAEKVSASIIDVEKENESSLEPNSKILEATAPNGKAGISEVPEGLVALRGAVAEQAALPPTQSLAALRIEGGDVAELASSVLQDAEDATVAAPVETTVATSESIVSPADESSSSTVSSPEAQSSKTNGEVSSPASTHPTGESTSLAEESATYIAGKID